MTTSVKPAASPASPAPELNAIGYFRVSTLEQAVGNNSIDVQQAKFSFFCKSNDLKSLSVFVDKQSARTAQDRPEFQKMLQFCKKNHKNISCVVVADLSRFARNATDQGMSIANLASIGIRVISIDEQFVDNTAAGKLAGGMIGVFNQFFSDSLSEKTKFRMESCVKNGRFVWVAPLGYINEKNGKESIIKIDKQRAPLVRKGFELMATGRYSADETLRTLNVIGLSTRTGKPVPRQTWYAILKNPIYCGWVKSKDLLVKGVHEPIVTQELFDSVQQAMQDNGKGNKTRQAFRPEFPLRQFVKCFHCGKGLTAGVIKKKFLYYWCYNKQCRKVLVSAQHLEYRFIHLLVSYGPSIELLKQLPMIVEQQWKVREARLNKDIKVLQDKLTEITRLNQLAVKAKLTGELTKEDFDGLKLNNAEESARINREIKSFESELSMMIELIQQGEHDLLDLASAWRKSGVKEKRELQQVIFPDGLYFHAESDFLNHKNKSLIDAWDVYLQELTKQSAPVDDFLVRFGVLQETPFKPLLKLYNLLSV